MHAALAVRGGVPGRMPVIDPDGGVSAGFGFGPSRMWEGPEAVMFDGTDGTAWHVVECAGAGIPGARGPFCLIFFSEGVVRRIWDYPEEWRSLELQDLEALMGSA